MSDVAVAQSPPSTDPRQHKLLRIAAWIVGTLVVLVLLQLAGIDVWGWFTQLWDTVTEISLGYLILGCLFQGLQTVLTALGWYGILRYAYPGGVTYMPVLAAYATGVALNNFVPANMGTFVMLLMYVAIVKGATFPGVLGGYVVQKIFYFIIGGVHLPLPLQCRRRLVRVPVREREGRAHQSPRPRPRHRSRRDLPRHDPAADLLGVGEEDVGERRSRERRSSATSGAYVKWVLLPQMGGYAAKVMVIIVFLAAYGIPVTFGSVMSVLGSNQLANILSFTPGGIGVNQAFNSFALESYTDTTTATAYSLGQQLITTAFNVGFAILLICIVFGWQGGSKLVKDSYADAKVKKDEMGADRREKREAKKDARREGGRSGLLGVFRRSGDDHGDTAE